MFLEILAEERLVGEVHLLSYLLDALRRVLQQHAQLNNHVVVNPLVRSATADLLHRFREILGGNAQLPGIPADAAFPTTVFLHHFDKPRKNDVASLQALVSRLLELIDHVAHIVEQGQ